MVKFDVKIVMLGQGGVGKTSLVRRYVQNTFSHNYQQTIGSNFLLKKLELDKNTRMLMQLWDLSGQDSFRSVRSQYFLYSRGAILVFDLTRTSTLYALDKWFDDLIKRAGEIPLMVIGNKVDLEEQIEVDTYEAESIAEKFNAKYVETSALTGAGVEDTFRDLAWQIIKQISAKSKKED
ncbi:MAG: Rab family GTPase [Candidatus Hodarchaeales archaeon]|jgi:small GTP-binding protein